jgi:hypothetical protein
MGLECHFRPMASTPSAAHYRIRASEPWGPPGSRLLRTLAIPRDPARLLSSCARAVGDRWVRLTESEKRVFLP